MNKKRLLISLLILVAMSILYTFIMGLTNHKLDYISWCGGVIFFETGVLLGEWVFSDENKK